MTGTLPLTLILLIPCLTVNDLYSGEPATTLQPAIVRAADAGPQTDNWSVSGDYIRTSTEARCYPNPIRPSSGQTLKFVVFLEKEGSVTIEVFDLLGNPVWERKNIDGAMGENNGSNDPDFTWDARDNDGQTVAAGGYIVRIIAPVHTHYVKVAVQK